MQGSIYTSFLEGIYPHGMKYKYSEITNINATKLRLDTIEGIKRVKIILN
jgi:hypothetical protein